MFTLAIITSARVVALCSAMAERHHTLQCTNDVMTDITESATRNTSVELPLEKLFL